ncbi:MAG: N-acetyltransferase [Actinomycetota bacterium]|jgi:hypothetical protein|nr:N-acetyltransferase [Actinomycetota bacterium]
MIRKMSPSDVPQVAALAQQKREQYQDYQPQFWRVADNAVGLHTPFVEHMVNDDSFVAFVATEGDEITGFVTGRLVPSPPVYNPGGPAAYIDDFHVASPDLWATTGRDLLRVVTEQLASRGAAQVVVVCGHRDQAKRAALSASGLSLATEWYVGSTGSREGTSLR